ncbi:hypothetical protein C5L31_001437 [Secundilactobacillus malefermentans]|uniref:Sugar-binding domain-containing protein n=1 Tax=Secundilactobacillus malefermentans TaxID=176292 RepID=A0A4V3A3Z0_9LACO|nr:sugar-binding transcriptional regulator [Secundilactobacillus malefermentans]KRM60206.1 citrate lyase regulator [Secundilactobacillus malefermentans DSM 5705 = KCTC 3548]TDG78251.1 hypothetical protein C5L31_001437 [Secundilactobacillus malefermentans]
MSESRQVRFEHGLQVAKLYYEQNMSQSQIAKAMSISRPTVSRLLQFARDQGIVRIQINDLLMDVSTLEAQLRSKYQIDVHVVPTRGLAVKERLSVVGQAAAQYLESITKPQDIIGIGWGKTIYSVGSHLSEMAVPGVMVVQMKGGVSYSEQPTYAFESINAFAHAFQTYPQYLPLPVIFDNLQTKQLVEQERHIQQVTELSKEANIAVFSVGTVRDNAMIFQLGYLKKAEITYLKKHAVGDIFSRFIDKDGQIADETLNERTIGISLPDLKTKAHAILVVCGDEKVTSTDAALKGGYANCLVIDQHAAQKLLDYD